MSRTDVHRPIWVQRNDPTVRHWFMDHHDHTNGECDLEFNLIQSWIGPGPHCYRTPWTQCPNLCGCNLCTGRPWETRRRRWERHTWRRKQNELQKLNRNDLLDAEWEVYKYYAW